MDYAADGKPSIETCQGLAREMEAITTEARELLQSARGRRKFDFHSRRGWLELQDGLLSSRVSNGLSTESLVTLKTLSCRWLHRYQHFVYVASTRPVWNS